MDDPSREARHEQISKTMDKYTRELKSERTLSERCEVRDLCVVDGRLCQDSEGNRRGPASFGFVLSGVESIDDASRQSGNAWMRQKAETKKFPGLLDFEYRS